MSEKQITEVFLENEEEMEEKGICKMCGGKGEVMIESGPTPDGDVQQDWVKCECRLGENDDDKEYEPQD